MRVYALNMPGTERSYRIAVPATYSGKDKGTAASAVYQIANRLLVWSAGRTDEPDILITPVGVFYTTRYTQRFDQSLAHLRHRVDEALKLLAVQGNVELSSPDSDSLQLRHEAPLHTDM